MLVCKVCGNSISEGQAYCTACGADAVENYVAKCPSCGTNNTAGSRYCANCGGILKVILKPTCVVCGAKNMPGTSFCTCCGAPILPTEATHTAKDILEARDLKLKVENLERERLAFVEKEAVLIRQRAESEREDALKDVELFKKEVKRELDSEKELLSSYRKMLDSIDSEDVSKLRKLSQALKEYAVYYADPYTEFDEDDIQDETYVCPHCGTINALNVVACSHCGKNKARATLLLAKGLIKQVPPVKRKKRIISKKAKNLDAVGTPTIEEFKKLQERPDEKETMDETKTLGQGAQFSPYANQPFATGYPAYPPYGVGLTPDGQPYQMTPIVQPVAFVPYVSQEQPLVQYASEDKGNSK